MGVIRLAKEVLSEGHLKIVLRRDKGTLCNLTKYEIHDVTDAGSNFCSQVISVTVDYIEDGQDLSVSYFVKYFSCPSSLLASIFERLFKNEANFYANVLPKMNKILKEVGEPPLCTAKYLFSLIEPEVGFIFLNNLSKEGYKVKDLPFDVAHSTLILRELGRFHAASMLLFKHENINTENVAERYPLLYNSIFDIDRLLHDNGIHMVESSIDTTIHICNKIPDHDYISNYLKDIKNVDAMWETMMTPTDKFMAIRHGDLKSNNVLFK